MLLCLNATVHGRLVLAIECDGATYHSAPTARDRDRLRQQHLEALGWRFHRIWSTDWFTGPEDEVERAIAAFNESVAYANRIDAGDVGVTGRESGHAEGTVSDAAVAATNLRERRPDLSPLRPITEYHLSELHQLIDWIESDGRLRADDEIVGEMVRELGFLRRGHRIDAALRAALRSHRPRDRRE